MHTPNSCTYSRVSAGTYEHSHGQATLLIPRSDEGATACAGVSMEHAQCVRVCVYGVCASGVCGVFDGTYCITAASCRKSSSCLSLIVSGSSCFTATQINPRTPLQAHVKWAYQRQTAPSSTTCKSRHTLRKRP